MEERYQTAIPHWNQTAIPQCAILNRDVPFLFRIAHCGIWDRYIMRFVRIRTINNAYYIWWSNWEPSICSLGRVQIHPTKMEYYGKSPLVQKLYGKHIWHLNIWKPKCNSVLCVPDKHFGFHFDEILLFYKLVCTQHWSQISGSIVDHQK